MKNLVLKW